MVRFLYLTFSILILSKTQSLAINYKTLDLNLHSADRPNFVPRQPQEMGNKIMQPNQFQQSLNLDLNQKTQNISKDQQEIIDVIDEDDGDVDNPRTQIFYPKEPTPNRLHSANLSKPINFSNSNNLIRKPGSFYQAVGEVMHIKGKVTDSFGVPISGVVIDIWQTNSAGKYQTLLENNSDFMDRNFNMSGKAITDNMGNYNFITIMPGYYLNRAPHVNMNIYHKAFGKIETEMYFENHPKNKFDHEYLSYSDEERELLTSKVRLSNMFNKRSYKICTFDIVMQGVHKYKSFGGV